MEILSRCGFRCDLCPAYNPNIKSFEDKKEISEKWQKYFGFYLAPEKVGCDGCINNEAPLDTECQVRPCANEKKLENCVYCEDFGCDKLKSRMNAFEEVTSKFTDIPERDYRIFLLPFNSKKYLMEIRNRT